MKLPTRKGFGKFLVCLMLLSFAAVNLQPVFGEKTVSVLTEKKKESEDLKKSIEGKKMTWFEVLTGFGEESPEQVRKNLLIDGDRIKSLVNGRSFAYGQLETPSLGDLRQRVASSSFTEKKLKLREVVGNVQNLHTDPANAGAIFQVASQFNLLEMTSPQVIPEQGIGIYEHDHTQGPACAIAAGAGTIYRNYFVPVNGKTGQSADNQIDCLAELGNALGNPGNILWKQQNGYALLSFSALRIVDSRLRDTEEVELDRLRGLLRIGIQWQAEVTLKNAGHTVSQAYCSALPVAYSDAPPKQWERFARLVLEASYEAAVCAGIINAQKTGCNRVYLTKLGGGVFGNEKDWIFASLKRALKKYEHFDLDVVIVSYGSSDPDVQKLIEEFAR